MMARLMSPPSVDSWYESANASRRLAAWKSGPPVAVGAVKVDFNRLTHLFSSQHPRSGDDLSPLEACQKEGRTVACDDVFWRSIKGWSEPKRALSATYLQPSEAIPVQVYSAFRRRWKLSSRLPQARCTMTIWNLENVPCFSVGNDFGKLDSFYFYTFGHKKS